MKFYKALLVCITSACVKAATCITYLAAYIFLSCVFMAQGNFGACVGPLILIKGESHPFVGYLAFSSKQSWHLLFINIKVSIKLHQKLLRIL